VGLLGLTFSAGRGLFIFAPPLLLALAFFPRFWSRHTALCAATIVMAAGTLALYSRWWSWTGTFLCYGPRFLLPLVLAGYDLLCSAEDMAEGSVRQADWCLMVFGD
jgi:hypothetical protein